MTTETTTFDINSLTLNQLQAMIARKEQLEREAAEAQALSIKAFQADMDSNLEVLSAAIARRSTELGVHFTVAFNAELNTFVCTTKEALSVSAPRATRSRQIGTSIQANIAHNSMALVDGVQYRSYAEYATEHYGPSLTRDGRPCQRNDRTFLASKGHIVGPPTR